MDFLIASAPSRGGGLRFWYAGRGMLRADRTEREEAARMEREFRDATRDQAHG